MTHVYERATKHGDRRFVRDLPGDKSHEHSGNGRQVISSTRGPANMSTLAATGVTDIHRVDQVYLAALVTSAALCRLFVRHVCSSWQFDEERTGLAELLASELAANAIQASGVAEPQHVSDLAYTDLKFIGIRLLGLRDGLVIEIWDTSPKPPVLLSPSDELEHGRGLQLVDALSVRWGYYDARMGGKVVWCEIADDAPAMDSSALKAAHQKALEALQGLAWNEQA